LEYKKREEEKEKARKGRVECNGSRFRPADRPTDRNIKQTSLTVTRSQWCDVRESPVDGVTVCWEGECEIPSFSSSAYSDVVVAAAAFIRWWSVNHNIDNLG
jgi:hypothetical protein